MLGSASVVVTSQWSKPRFTLHHLTLPINVSAEFDSRADSARTGWAHAESLHLLMTRSPPRIPSFRRADALQESTLARARWRTERTIRITREEDRR